MGQCLNATSGVLVHELAEAEDRERLPVRHCRQRDLLIELEIRSHCRAERDLLQLALVGDVRVSTYQGLPEQEAFDIEYWKLEEADRSAKSTGNITNVDGGNAAAFTR